MSTNVREFIRQRLSEWGLHGVYGDPREGAGGLDLLLERAKDVMQYIQVRDEEMAAFTASANAKFTGEVGLWTYSVRRTTPPSARRRAHG